MSPYPRPAAHFAIYKATGKPIPGLGDEALTGGGTAYLRVGNVMLSVGESSFDQAWEVEMFRKMAPKMK